jgi:ribosomal protein S12 methylthiotransferase
MEELLLSAKNLAAKGTKEIILIAQDLTYYGLDIYKKRNLAEFLDRLSDVEGIDWIRLQYAYPSGFPMDILDVMAKKPNICKYLDMPLQHGSSEMLKIMRRGIDRPKTEQLLADIRNKVPDIAIRTTLIAGHPGETEEMFEEMYNFVKEQRFDRLGVFQYSHEDDTHSYQLNDDIPAEEKQERVDIIMELQQGISDELNQKKLGNTYKVLFDRKESGYFIGRTQYDSPEVDNEVLVSADEYLRLGDFADVKITSAAEFDLYGTLIK